MSDNKSPEPEVVEAVGGSGVSEAKEESSPPSREASYGYGGNINEKDEGGRTERAGQKEKEVVVVMERMRQKFLQAP